MPSETDREERRAIDAKLDTIARRLTINVSPTAPLSTKPPCALVLITVITKKH
jgi:hypothetical protein